MSPPTSLRTNLSLLTIGPGDAASASAAELAPTDAAMGAAFSDDMRLRYSMSLSRQIVQRRVRPEEGKLMDGGDAMRHAEALVRKTVSSRPRHKSVIEKR